MATQETLIEELSPYHQEILNEQKEYDLTEVGGIIAGAIFGLFFLTLF